MKQRRIIDDTTVFRRQLFVFTLLLAAVVEIRETQAYGTNHEATDPIATEDQAPVQPAILPSEFPKAELESALADLCSHGDSNSAAKQWTQAEIQARI